MFTVDKKIIKSVLKNVIKRAFGELNNIYFIKRGLKNVIKRAFGELLASLITFFRTCLIKFYLNSQRVPDSFYHMTESKKIRVLNILIA